MGDEPIRRVPIALITAITALGSVSVSLYVPSLPSIAVEFAADPAEVRLTLTAFLVTFALAQLAYGPLSDSYGRRPLVVGGAVIYVLGSIACLAAPTLTLLIAARIVQAIGASAGPALGRAIVRDVIPADRIAGVLAIMATAIALSPTLGPFVGGLVESAAGWRSGFLLLTFVGLVLGALLFWRLPETAPGDRTAPLSAITIIRTYGGLLGDPTYLLFLICGGLLTAGNFAWVAAAPFLFIQEFGFSTAEFGLVSLAVGGGYAAGAIVVIRVGRHFDTSKAVVAGALLSVCGALGLVAAAWWHAPPLGLVAAISVYAVGMGIAVPSSAAGALTRHPEAAGSAAALIGGLQIALGSCGTMMASLSGGAGATGLAGIVVAVAVASLAAALLVRRRAARQPTQTERCHAAAA